MNHLHARIAVSQAARWTALRFFGGRYTIVPNGVDLQPPRESRREPGPVRILFIGQAVARKGLAVLLAAFERLREEADVELTLIGASAADVEHMILDGSAITALGKVDDAEKQARLRGADIVCAPSLGGESFGMVLTEAFAAGAPVVASDIPGYRDVVRDGVDGLLVPPDDAGALRDALQELVADADRRSAMSIAARTHAERFAWPRVAAEVAGVYEQALAVPEPTGRRARLALRSGLRSADMLPAVPAERLPSLRSPEDSRGAGRGGRRSRLPRPVVLGGVIALLAALAYAAHVDVGAVLSTLFSSEPGTVLGALVVMCLAMSLRAGAWKLLLRSSDVDRQPSLRQVLNATYIGVLMSATLPARMGEPSRAFVLARHTGDLARSLPRVTRTIVAQSLINVVALGVLAAFGASGTSIGQAHRVLLILLAFVPLAAILLFSALPYAIAAVPGSTRLEAIASSAAALGRLVLDGLSFRAPLSALAASVAQLAAWGLQLLGCWLVLMAFGLEHTVGFAGAAAVLFAINITSVLPATPANVGVFQAACALVLVGGFHVSAPSAIAFGIVLQAVELATAMLMGFPALAAEHLSWRQLRRRALHLGSVSKLRRPALVER
jgi:phosphatidylinositol alpha-mannosyltransferase